MTTPTTSPTTPPTTPPTATSTPGAPITIAETLARLDALRDAARANDHRAYLSALAAARPVTSDAQIRDAYSWGLQKRMTLDRHLSGVLGFDWQGNPQ